MSKDLRELEKALNANGIIIKDVDTHGNSHQRLRLEYFGQERLMTVSKTAGDYRTIKNNLTLAKRLFRMPASLRG